MLRHFLLYFGGAVPTLTDGEGRREARRSSQQTRSAWEVTGAESSSAAALLLSPHFYARRRASLQAGTGSIKQPTKAQVVACVIPRTERYLLLPVGGTWSQGGARVPLRGAPSKDKLTTHLTVWHNKRWCCTAWEGQKIHARHFHAAIPVCSMCELGFHARKSDIRNSNVALWCRVFSGYWLMCGGGGGGKGGCWTGSMYCSKSSPLQSGLLQITLTPPTWISPTKVKL